MENSLTRLIQSSLVQYSGTDENNIFGVPAASERRRRTVHRLLEEAKNIIAEEGVEALTFRKLSARCGMGVGNVQYYFPSSQDILHALMRFIISDYLGSLLDSSFRDICNPDERLRTFLEVQFKDVQQKRTNSIFIALWDLAQRDAFVSEWLGEIYSVERTLLRSMLAEIHPQFSEREILDRSVAIAALIEGMMPLFGPATKPSADLGDVHGAAIRFACYVAGIEPPAAKN